MAYQLPRGVSSIPIAVKTFARERQGITILLRIDNMTTKAYVRQQSGGTVSPKMNRIVKELWLWCLQKREIHLQAEHLAGVLNTIADEESGVMKDRSDWMLDQRVFQSIQTRTGSLSFDLFAQRLTTQLPKFLAGDRAQRQ